MDITNSDLIEATVAMSVLQERKLPVRAAFKIKRNLKTLQPIAQDVQEERQELLKEYAKLDDDGEVIKAKNANVEEVAVFDDDNQSKFEDAVKELMDTVVEDVSIQQIDLEKLEQAGTTVEPALMVDSVFTFGDE